MRGIRIYLLTALLLVTAALPLFALPKAAYLGASAVVPGTGELALGKTAKGSVLLGVDILALSSYWATGRQKNNLINSYQRYGQVYAGIPEDMPESYYQHIQEYASSEEFNQFQELMARNYYLIYSYDPANYDLYLAENTYPQDEAWRWQSEQHQQHYRKLRRQTQTVKMYQNLSLGVMLLNRAISIIDVALISRDRKNGSTLYFTPLESAGLMLNYQWEF